MKLAAIAAAVLIAGVSKTSEPVGCLLPDWCGILPFPCEVECAAAAEFTSLRYCPGHLSDGYVSHPVFGGWHAYRLRSEANGDMLFVTSSDLLFYDDAETPACGDWGLHLR